jgi:hypothetical protein
VIDDTSRDAATGSEQGEHDSRSDDPCADGFHPGAEFPVGSDDDDVIVRAIADRA